MIERLREQREDVVLVGLLNRGDLLIWVPAESSIVSPPCIPGDSPIRKAAPAAVRPVGRVAGVGDSCTLVKVPEDGTVKTVRVLAPESC